MALTWSEKQPQGANIISGKWWSNPKEPSIAVSERIAQRLHLKPGSQITLMSGEKNDSGARVCDLQKRWTACLRKKRVHPEPERSERGFQWYGMERFMWTGRWSPPCRRALFAAYPTVTVINIADVLDTIQGFVGQINGVVRFLAGFSMLSGAIILASSVASTRFRRIREVVVLKTLGARRNHVVKVFSTEFLVLGLLAGIVGVVFANVLSRVLLHNLQVPYHIDWPATLSGIVLTAVLAVGTGWIASFHILGQKPLEVLREE